MVLEKWIYKHIEESLYNYAKLKESKLDTEKKLAAAIEETLEYFKGSDQEKMMREYYFKAKKQSDKYSKGTFHNKVCYDVLFIDPSSGYVIRREIVLRVALSAATKGVYRFGKK